MFEISADGDLSPGLMVVHNKLVYQFLGEASVGRAQIRRISNQGSIEVPTESLRPISVYRLQLDRLKPLHEYPESKQLIAIKRRDVIEDLLETGCKPEETKKAANLLEVSTLTVNRWVDWYLCSGRRVAVLVPGVFRYGLGHNFLTVEIEQIIEECITTRYLTDQRLSKRELVRLVRRTCRKRGLKQAPSSSAINERLKSLPPDEVTLHRLGAKAVREQHAGQPKRAPDGGQPLGLVEIDHTKLDVFVLDEEGNKSRPYITVALDVFTRMVLGFHLTLAAPSSKSVAVCLFRAMSAKEDWLRGHGITTSWPCFGVPLKVQTDNAKEFLSEHLENLALDHGFILQRRPVGRCEWGAFIERIMGRLAYRTHLLPGTTFSSVVEKQDYDSEAKATLTRFELERILLRFFVEIYHHSSHSGLDRRTPISVWEEYFPKGSVSLEPPTQRASLDLLYSMLPSFERTIQQRGVAWECDEYFDPRIVRYVGRKNSSQSNGLFRFHYDPDHVRYIYFRDPKTDQWLKIGPRDPGLIDQTEEDRLIRLKIKANQGPTEKDQSIVDDGETAIEEVIQNAGKRSRKIRKRENAQKRKHKASHSAKENVVEKRESQPPANRTGILASMRQELTIKGTDPAVWESIPKFGRRNP